MNNAVFRKIMENLRKHGDIKLVTTESRRNYLDSEPNDYTIKLFTFHRTFISNRNEKKDRDIYK